MPDDTVEGADLAHRAANAGRELRSGRIDPDTVPLSRALIDAICHAHPFVIAELQLHWPA